MSGLVATRSDIVSNATIPAVDTCCAHQEDEHQIQTICTEQIHYPSEDYPCLCEGMSGSGVCLTCGHKAASHLATRVCVPLSGEACDCGRPG